MVFFPARVFSASCRHCFLATYMCKHPPCPERAMRITMHCLYPQAVIIRMAMHRYRMVRTHIFAQRGIASGLRGESKWCRSASGMVHFKTVNSEVGIRSLLEGLHDVEEATDIKEVKSVPAMTFVRVLAKTMDERLPACQGCRKVTFRFVRNTGNVTIVTGRQIEGRMLEIIMKVDELYAASIKTGDDGKTIQARLPSGCQKVFGALRFPPRSNVQSKDLASDSEEWVVGINSVAVTAWSCLRSNPKERRRLVDCLVKNFGCPSRTIDELVAVDSEDEREWTS